MAQSFGGDDRGTSEGAGVAVLVLFTVIVTATVGVSVLFVDQDADEGIQADFSYDYFSERAALLITYEAGDELPTDEIVIVGPAGNATWQEIAPDDAPSALEPGSRIQLTDGNQYGHAIRDYHQIRIVHVQGENRTMLSQWNATGQY